jgi:DNA-binding response OmpR family regulator
LFASKEQIAASWHGAEREFGRGMIVARFSHRWLEMAESSRKTVLIVEKQPNYTQPLVKQVLFAGLKAIVAVTGEGGLRKAIDHHPDLILLELDLTDMDGLEFVSLLKEKPQLERIPIVAMSIFSYMKTAALYGGCDDFLQKPVKMIELMARIRHYLHKPASIQAEKHQATGLGLN